MFQTALNHSKIYLKKHKIFRNYLIFSLVLLFFFLIFWIYLEIDLWQAKKEAKASIPQVPTAEQVPPPTEGILTRVEGSKVTLKGSNGNEKEYILTSDCLIYPPDQNVAIASKDLNLLKKDQKVILTLEDKDSLYVRGVAILE